MYKVFSSVGVVILTDDHEGHSLKGDGLYLHFDSAKTIELGLETLHTNQKLRTLVIWHDNLEELLRAFKDSLTVVHAGGGIVKNEKNETLFIFRKGKWDLPKGKLDQEEAIETCAIREVEEECGVVDISITKVLPITYHMYEENNENVLKETHWFEMTCEGNQQLTPQAEEDITEVEWVSKDGMGKIRENTYDNLIWLLDQI